MFDAIYDRGASGRNLSPKLWKHIPASAGGDPSRGTFFFNDFHTLLNTADDFTFTNATSGTIALDLTTASANQGVCLLDSGATTATQGCNLQWGGPMVTPAAGTKIAFEARVKVSAATTGPEFFCGLADTDTTIITGGDTVSSGDHVAFSSVTDNNVLLFLTEDATVAGPASASPHTLVNDTYVKLGFLIDGVTSDVEIYVDGAVVANTATLNIPSSATATLYPSFVCQANDTTQPIMHIDWFAVGVD